MRLMPGVLCLVLSAGCGDDDEPTQRADAGSNEGDDRDDEELREVACTDESVSQLMLFKTPTTGGIREEGAAAGAGAGKGEFVTYVDATAGGALNPMQSYVYAKFTEDGLEKVDLDDEEAFESIDWDIAFRRYVVRLNSGVSGPGEVTGGRTAANTEFESVTEVPDGIEFRTESYFTEDGCEYVPDTSGIEAPQTALGSYWKYMGCVQMTGNVYVVALPDDRHVKLQVLSYYPVATQAQCNETGTIPVPSGAGNLRVRWAFLE